MKCKLSRGHRVHDMVYYAIWNCTSINLVNNEQTPSAKNLWCQTCLHLKGSRCKNHILKCIPYPTQITKMQQHISFIFHLWGLIISQIIRKGDASWERLVWFSSRGKYGNLKTLFYGVFKKSEFCQSSGFIKGYKNLFTL